MTDFSSMTQASASGMKAQSYRLRLASENMANADTPGYRRKLTSFSAVMGTEGKTGEVRANAAFLDRSALERIYDPSNPLSDETGNYDGSNVDMVIEMADAREAQRSYEANLRMFDQARQMSKSLLELLRK